MRWSDEYMGYAGVVLGFAAVVLWAADANGAVVATAGAAGALLLLAMVWSATHTQHVLVVGPRRTEAIDVAAERLDDAGYAIRSCDGPGVHPCPVWAGRPCPIHAPVVAAVIVRDPDDVDPAPPCGSALHVPAIVVDATASSEVPRVLESEMTRHS